MLFNLQVLLFENITIKTNKICIKHIVLLQNIKIAQKAIATKFLALMINPKKSKVYHCENLLKIYFAKKKSCEHAFVLHKRIYMRSQRIISINFILCYLVRMINLSTNKQSNYIFRRIIELSNSKSNIYYI